MLLFVSILRFLIQGPLPAFKELVKLSQRHSAIFNMTPQSVTVSTCDENTPALSNSNALFNIGKSSQKSPKVARKDVVTQRSCMGISTELDPEEITKADVVGSWQLTRHKLVPSADRLLRMSEVLAGIVEDDLLLEFRFAGCECQDSMLFVHWSRIDFAGAKLPALTGSDCAHHNRGYVSLGTKDTLEIFTIIRRFLYCQVLDFVRHPSNFMYTVLR